MLNKQKKNSEESKLEDDEALAEKPKLIKVEGEGSHNISENEDQHMVVHKEDEKERTEGAESSKQDEDGEEAEDGEGDKDSENGITVNLTISKTKNHFSNQ